MNTLVYDVEILKGPEELESGWDSPQAMGFGTAVVYDYKNDRYWFFGPDQKDALIVLLSQQTVVSFNGIKFDNRVILGDDYNEPNTERLWGDYDILLEVVKSKFHLDSVAEAEAKLGDKEVHDGSVSLNGLSRGTLGLGKTGHGAHAPQLIREAKWADVFAYKLSGRMFSLTT